MILYVRFPLSLRNVEDLLHERCIDVSRETVRFWWNKFGPIFSAKIWRNRVSQMRAHSNWQWQLDKVETGSNEPVNTSKTGENTTTPFGVRSAIGYRPPAPENIVQMDQRPVMQ